MGGGVSFTEMREKCSKERGTEKPVSTQNGMGSEMQRRLAMVAGVNIWVKGHFLDCMRGLCCVSGTPPCSIASQLKIRYFDAGALIHDLADRSVKLTGNSVKSLFIDALMVFRCVYY